MNTQEVNPDGYQQSSAINFAEGLSVREQSDVVQSHLFRMLIIIDNHVERVRH